MTDDLPLFTPPVPSGPQSVVPVRAQNSYVAYLHWRASEDGIRAWDRIQYHALRLERDGAARISTKALVEMVRGELKVDINNTATPWLADDLIRRYPQFERLIERRVRRKKAS